MQGFATNVVNFNEEILGIAGRNKELLNVDELNLTTKCLREEVSEFETAHLEQDYIGAIDALIDLMYFAVGGLHKLGVSVNEMERCAEAVHNCNMAKKRGQKKGRETGNAIDAVKPEGWVSPEEKIAEIIGGCDVEK